MLVLLDTTAILRDPLCAGTAWRVLAHARSAWDVRIVVSEVVIAEAVAGYQRKVQESLAGFTRWAEKHGRPLGLSRTIAAAEGETREAIEGYEARLRRALGDAGVTIVDPPDTPHMVVVARAVQRRKPCDDNGNGYRDTLNWLTLLGLVADNPNEEIVWVTNDSGDFANEQGDGLHADLLAELEELGATARVTWMREVPDLVLRLAAERAPDLTDDLAAVAEKLRNETVLEYLASRTLTGKIHTEVSAQACGLPVSTQAAQIVTIGNVRDLALDIRGSVADAEGVAEFSVLADTVILVDVADPDELVGDNLVTPPASGPTGATASIVKPLRYTGVLTFGRYDRPLDAEVTKISATADDAGLARWLRLSNWLGAVSAWQQLVKQQSTMPSTAALEKLLKQASAAPSTAAMEKLLNQVSAAPSTAALEKLLNQVSAAPTAALEKLLNQVSAAPTAAIDKLLKQASTMPSGWVHKSSDSSPINQTRDVSTAERDAPPTASRDAEPSPEPGAGEPTDGSDESAAPPD